MNNFMNNFQTNIAPITAFIFILFKCFNTPEMGKHLANMKYND